MADYYDEISAIDKNKNNTKLHELCKRYNANLYTNFSDGWYHVYAGDGLPGASKAKKGYIISWGRVFVPNPDWVWIEEQVVNASLEVFQ